MSCSICSVKFKMLLLFVLLMCDMDILMLIYSTQNSSYRSKIIIELSLGVYTINNYYSPYIKEKTLG